MDFTEKRIKMKNKLGDVYECYISHFNDEMITFKDLKNNDIQFCISRNKHRFFDKAKPLFIEAIQKDEVIDSLDIILTADGLDESDKNSLKLAYLCDVLLGKECGASQDQLKARCESTN